MSEEKSDEGLAVPREQHRHGQTVDDVLLDEILSSVKLPGGRRVPNRLVKVAMYEHLADFYGGPPNDAHFSLYRRWADAKWGMIITGNVQVCKDHLSLGRDMVVPTTLSEGNIRPFRQLATVIHGPQPQAPYAPLAIMQLSHCGRQSANVIGGRTPFSPPLAPSAVPLQLSSKSEDIGVVGTLLHKLMFQAPVEMSRKDIDEVVRAFVRGAELAARSGFDGIELHAGHGYLLSQFMSPKANLRTDEWSMKHGDLSLLHHIVTSIRKSEDASNHLVIGIKLNAADYVNKKQDNVTLSESDLERPLLHVIEIASWGMVDFIEVSGGDYEHPDFMNNKGPTTSQRQALFADFSQRAMQVLEARDREHRPLILLTGGLRTLELLSSALAQTHADLLGIGRMSVICPDLPKRLSDHRIRGQTDVSQSGKMLFPESFASNSLRFRVETFLCSYLYFVWDLIPTPLRPRFPILIGAGVEMAKYIVAMRSLARGNKQPGTSEGIFAIIWMWLYIAPVGGSTLERRVYWAVVGGMAGIYIGIAMLIAWFAISSSSQ